MTGVRLSMFPFDELTLGMIPCRSVVVILKRLRNGQNYPTPLRCFQLEDAIYIPRWIKSTITPEHWRFW